MAVTVKPYHASLAARCPHPHPMSMIWLVLYTSPRYAAMGYTRGCEIKSPVISSASGKYNGAVLEM